MSTARVPLVDLEVQAPLPLMVPPYCNKHDPLVGLLNTAQSGRHFYKCEHQWTGKCKFWKWEDQYLNVLRTKWPRLFIHSARDGGKYLRTLIRLALVNLIVLPFVCSKVI